MKKLFYVEFLFVRFEIILDDKFGKLSVFDLENGGLLAFELLVNSEKCDISSIICAGSSSISL